MVWIKGHPVPISSHGKGCSILPPAQLLRAPSNLTLTPPWMEHHSFYRQWLSTF